MRRLKDSQILAGIRQGEEAVMGYVMDKYARLLWNIADITMGGMTLINMPVIIILSKYAIGALKDYDRQKKEGKDPVFKAKNIGIPEDMVDYWE